MSKRFTTYDELVKEKQQLEVLLKAQKQLIRTDIYELKAEFQPILGFVKKLTTKDKSSMLLNIGSDIVINTVFKKLILARAGWLAKIVVPYLMKNYSSHFLADNKKKWFHKLASWLGHKNGKDKHKDDVDKTRNEGESFTSGNN